VGSKSLSIGTSLATRELRISPSSSSWRTPSGLNMLGGARGIPVGPCCAMITERMACTKRARLAGMAVVCAAPLDITSSGKVWQGSSASGFGGAVIGDGEQVLRDPEGLYCDVLIVEEGAWVNELHESDGGGIISVVGRGRGRGRANSNRKAFTLVKASLARCVVDSSR
jgi:hypothetical protein